METTATFEGTTKEELELRILHVENILLNNELEPWESKEYQDVIKEYKMQIDYINEAQEILNTL
jgi:hypothetical protein